MAISILVKSLSKRAELFRAGADSSVRCLACARSCLIAEGGCGFCGVRFNLGGELFAPWGYAAGLALDPVEKKPFFHVLPGAKAFSFGTLGCNFRCAFCQNSATSLPRWDDASLPGPVKLSPHDLVCAALQNKAGLVVSTYNEPLISAEWARAVFVAAKQRGLRTAFVSNGYASKEVLEYLRPCLDFYKADLKSFNAERHLKVTGARLEKVLKGIELVYSMGFWLEVVTLVVPGFNDSRAELEAAAAFIAGISKDIPWHVTAFYPAHLMADTKPAPPEMIMRAREIGLKKGLNFVYAGNIPESGGAQNTTCPVCEKLLVERRGFSVAANLLAAKGACPGCAKKIPGFWKL